MVGFAIFSIVLSYCLLNRTSGTISIFFHAVAIVGIMIHELCHFIMCLLTRTRIERLSLISIKRPEENGGKFGLKGEVRVNGERTTFLKAFLIGFAPLFVMFWFFFFMWDLSKNPELEYVHVLFYVGIMFSTALGAGPSFQDLTTILRSFSYDIKYSFYQIFLLFIAIGTAMLVIDINQIVIIHELYVYVIITFFYFVYKYSFLIVSHFLEPMLSDNYFLKSLNRTEKPKRYKPKRPKKGEEGSW